MLFYHSMTNILNTSNLKKTKAREHILNIIGKSKTPISAEDIFLQANKSSKVNLSTIYRTLSTLTEKRVLIKQVMPDQKSYYQIASHAHKHILHCDSCGSETPIKDCPMHAIEDKIAKETGFTIQGHNLEIHGVCQHCSQK